jgi:rubrerythrin
MENDNAVKTEAATATESAVKKARESYERFVQKLTDELKEAGKGGKKQWEDAVKSTRDFLAKAKPPLSREELEKVGDTVQKDVRHALRTIKEKGDAWTSSEGFLTARDKGAQFLLKLVHRIKETATTVETNLQETLSYKAGEVVSGGAFVCTSCSQELKVESADAIPTCAVCGKAEFKRKA